MKTIHHKDIYSFIKQSLKKVGVNKYSCEAVAHGLCFTSLRGVDSHGINLLPHYLLSALNGRKNCNPKFKFKKIFPALSLLEADNAFGHAACLKAINYSIKIAKKYGIAAVAVKNSSHCGALATFTLEAARNGYVAIGFTHADALVVPPNGIKPLLGTNPISFAFPRKKKSPICLDMSTSSISWNKLLSMDKKQSISPYIASDALGNSTTKQKEARGLFPLGGKDFSYKGFCLGVIVELFCSVLTGMKFGNELLPMYNTKYKPRKLGQFFILLRSDISMKNKDYMNYIEKFSRNVYSKKSKSNNGIKLPGDPEEEILKKRMKNGIPIQPKFISSLNEIEKKYSLKFNLKI